MSKAAKRYLMALSYDANSQEFTLLNSSRLRLTKKVVQKIFAGNYEGWTPQVLDKVDNNSDYKIILSPITVIQDKPNTPNYFSFWEEKVWEEKLDDISEVLEKI